MFLRERNNVQMLRASLSEMSGIMKQMRGLYARANSVLRKFAACSFEVKLRLFQAFCTSFYCAHLWYKFTKHVMTKVRVAYNNVFRLYLDIEEVAVPAKCLSTIIFMTLKVV